MMSSILHVQSGPWAMLLRNSAELWVYNAIFQKAQYECKLLYKNKCLLGSNVLSYKIPKADKGESLQLQ